MPATDERALAARRINVVLWGAVAAAWLVAVAAERLGAAWLVDHEVVAGRLGSGALLPFLLAWQVMLAAMMLPSAVPTIRLFAAIGGHQPRAGRAVASFVGGYAAVWTVFGALAFTGDLLVHELVAAGGWLAARPQLLAAGVLGVAGAFQLSGLKDRCLDRCRHPAGFLLPRYRRGAAAAFRIGRQHGLFCLGCCWALMLVMFAVGSADLRLMAGLAALMAYEKTGRHGRGVATAAGVLLLATAATVAVATGAG
ncbi:MAG TPA: DUF2182 domain-containing protein [Egibacteraceae bacterium]|nr:DUF2182 domain-containing protein [Egibacteraceae bacterium]